MHRTPQTAPARRARATVAGAVALVVGAIVSSAPMAAGQEGQPAPSTTAAPAPGGASSTTTTSAPPPVTVVLEDGDFGVVPPGGDEPTPPTDPAAPAEPGAEPAEGELEVPEELPVVILPDPTPGLNAALADIDITRASADLAAGEDGRRAAEVAVHEAFVVRTDAIAFRRAAGQRMLAAKAVTDQLAINAVMYGDIAAVEPTLGPPSLEDLRDIELSDVAAEKIFADLDAARVAYRSAVAAELAATTELMRTRQFARLVDAEYLRLRRALAEAIRKAEEARRQLGPTILGPVVLDTADLVAWYRTYYAADPPVAPIESIIDTYLRVGGEEGVAGDIAFAQAILETGGFRSGHAQGFNFAGIGAYDVCSPTCGFRFPDLDSGVRAHIHLLRAYADPGLTSAQLFAPPNRLVAPERVGVKGCCQRWTQLTGIWATDPNYDRKVLGIYRLMVETARALDRIRA